MFFKNKLFWVLLILVMVGFSPLLAHKDSAGQTNVDISSLEAKLDKISAQLNKLDTVLGNQAKILSELEVVKVRASRR